MTDIDLPASFKAQIDETTETPIEKPVVKTKLVNFHGKSWQIPAKPSARFLYHLESDHYIHAIEAALGDRQFERFMALDLDAEQIDGFFEVCNTAYGLAEGN